MGAFEAVELLAKDLAMCEPELGGQRRGHMQAALVACTAMPPAAAHRVGDWASAIEREWELQ